MTESEDNSKDDKQDKSENMLRNRLMILLIVVGGVSAALISYYTVGLDSLYDASTIVPASLFTIGVIHFWFRDVSKKTLPFIFLTTFLVWFITGTFILQI